jgi:hypothetical protein
VGLFTDAYPARDGADSGPLSRASRREMQSVQTIEIPQTIVANDGSSWPYFGGYGMGMFTDFDADLGHLCGHSGGVPGYGSNMRWITGSEPGAALHSAILAGSRIGVIALANTTYAPMLQVTRRVLQSMRVHGLAGPVAKQVPQALIAAAQNLFAELQRMARSSAEDRFAAGSALFADNVLLDEPLHERVSQAANFFAACEAGGSGPLRFVRCEADTDADATLVIANDQREFRIGFSLSVSPPGTIQAYKLPG